MMRLVVMEMRQTEKHGSRQALVQEGGNGNSRFMCLLNSMAFLIFAGVWLALLIHRSSSIYISYISTLHITSRVTS